MKTALTHGALFPLHLGKCLECPAIGKPLFKVILQL